ncbi:MAG: cytochrome c biogenesis protein CcsA [Bacteroidetes bacterium]|nr:cytochrome c biogenesis protein CcsA [Bacteroidota bacterium]
MNRFFNIIFSMQTMGFLLLVFAASIGTATFIENDFGTEAAKAVVYNTTWFNILMLLLAINLVANIFIYKLYKPKKFTIFLFHFAFLVILLGSAITRFVSYEGMMHIREGSSSNRMTSDQTYVDISITDGNDTVYNSEAARLTILTPESYSSSVNFKDKKYKFKAVEYIPNAQEVITEVDGNGDPYIVVVVSLGSGRQTNYYRYNTSGNIGLNVLNFGSEFMDNALNIKIENGALLMHSADTVFTMSMMGGTNDTLLPGQWHAFEQRNLYEIDNANLVLTNFYKNGGIDYVSYDGNDMNFKDAIIVEASSDDETKRIALRGGKGYAGETETAELNGATIQLKYGAKPIYLPFSLKLLDFQLERYPGSNSPSSFASEVVLIDKEEGLEMPYRIYMNHVLNYKGYRFFQSSYDRDELGTVLSVNHDYWGTFFTYVGYFLMSLGMFLTLFNKNSRFSKLAQVIKRKNNGIKAGVATLLISLLLISPDVLAQHTHAPGEVHPVDEEQAEKFGNLLTQTHDGRLKPVTTLASELVRKISRKSKIQGMNPEQVLLGMLSNPVEWQSVPMIKVKHPDVKKLLGVEDNLAAYIDFINMSQGTYKLNDHVSAAYNKKPAKRDMFDKDIIAVDERLNICYMLYNGDLINLLPNPTDSHASWYSANPEVRNVPAEDSAFLVQIIPSYLEAINTGNNQLADELVTGIANYQKKYGAEIMPSQSKINMELRYNKMNIFQNLSKLYLVLGLIMIILSFIEIFRQSKILNIIIKIFIVLIVIGFIYQTAGLAMRWYISGHAPWSDGYESLIYIAWVTLLAGLVFSNKSNMTIAATTFLTSIILMVAHLSWMDPEITNLVPVLKSYWLTIHVSIITASYGFLALSALLGLMNMILMIFKNHKNNNLIDLRISNLTAINERSIMVGLYMLTIGTFLGGVWANESWGRYWGWDPKETWALVSVLIYAFIAHMSSIPGLKDKFSFNFASLIAYGSILMTYFGVNYYLSGLHSYAAGDPVPIPTFVYYMVATVFVVSLWAYFNNRRFVDQSE